MLRYIDIRKKDRKGHRDKKTKKGGNKMDILITMAYTALMTFVMVKVTELVPSDDKRK